VEYNQTFLKKQSKISFLLILSFSFCILFANDCATTGVVALHTLHRYVPLNLRVLHLLLSVAVSNSKLVSLTHDSSRWLARLPKTRGKPFLSPSRQNVGRGSKFLPPSIALLFLFCLFFPDGAYTQLKKFYLKRSYPNIEAGGKLWIGTPSGLYQYSKEEDTWTLYDKKSGLPSNHISILEFQNELLWVGTDKGVAYINTRLNTIFSFDTSDGLPDNCILSIAFEKDYVWVGTQKGAARFDKLIEKWEAFTSNTGLKGERTSGVVVEGKTIWLATEAGLSEYDVAFEKWRYFSSEQGLTDSSIQFVVPTQDYLWLFCDSEVVRFNKRLRSFQHYHRKGYLEFEKMNDLTLIEDQLWLATVSGILIYEPGNDAWREFLEQNNLPEQNVASFTFSDDGKEIWFATSKGLAQYHRGEKFWRFYNQASGLDRDDFLSIAVSKGNVFAITFNLIDYLKPEQNRWYSYLLQKEESEEKLFSFDREKGSYINFAPGYKLNLSGAKTSYLSERKITDYVKIGGMSVANQSFSRSDLKAKLELADRRVANGFYNDADFSEVLYGVKYHGNREDWLQEAAWGDIRTEQGKKQLTTPLGIFGVASRLEFGAKTERYRRSLLNFIGYAGQKTTGFDNDFFTGATKRARFTVLDIDFIKNQYFEIDSSGLRSPIDSHSEEIYLDDGIAGNNTPNTLLNYFIAGVVGDFDKLIPVKDYSIDYQRGCILFNFAISDSAVLVIRYSVNQIVYEKILQSASVRNLEKTNRYFLGGIGIIPFTLNVGILDSDNHEHSLWEFGLDQNHDGMVDPEFVDFKQGVLAFPSNRPFLPEAYDPIQPVSRYRMQIQFESNIARFHLKHNRLVRGSEVLSVDGQLKIAGEDYILDYTSGTLLFVKEGVLNDDSEIEILYEYYRTVDENYYQLSAATGPSDNLWAETSYLAFDKADSTAGQTNRVQTLTGFSEIKWSIGGVAFRVTPEYAQSQSSSRRGKSVNIGSNISSSQIRLYANYRHLDESYDNVFERKFKLGRLKSETEAGAQYEPLDYLRLTTHWRQRNGFNDSLSRNGKENQIEGSILINKSQYPVLSLSAQRITTDLSDSTTQRTSWRADLEYILPEVVLKKLSIQSLTVSSFYRRSVETRNQSLQEVERRLYQNFYARISLSPIELININTYFRHNSLDAGFPFSEVAPAKSDDKLFFDVISDKLKGLSIGLRYVGEMWWYYYASISSLHDLRLQESFQVNSRIFPGQWIGFLLPFTFEANYQSNFSGYFRDRQEKPRILLSFFDKPEKEPAVQSTDGKFYQFKSEWRPTAEIVHYFSWDLSNSRLTSWNSLMDNQIRNLNNRLDYRPSIFAYLSLQFNYQSETRGDYYSRARYSPSVWLENRWSEDFLTRLNLYTYWESIEQGHISQKSVSAAPLVSLIYKNSSLWFLGRVEIKDDISLSYFDSEGYGVTIRNYVYANTLYLDFFPLPIAIIRVRMSNSLTQDKVDNSRSFWNHFFQVRAVVQF